ncbi:hypothetical protein TWF696_003774 [Orbilia brochopaga]|uniref:Uncharacterized protein n=1 Tax=Orbilia brochopaga TaxID=3140254 RepID=A0AAV9V5C1_9PEZI
MLDMPAADDQPHDSEALLLQESHCIHECHCPPTSRSGLTKARPHAAHTTLALFACIALLLGLSVFHFAPGIAARLRADYPFSFRQATFTDASGDARPLILYAYHETENARRNALFFIAHGLHAAADFIFILNGETNLTASLPDAPNIRYIQRPNTCFDMGSYKEVLSADDMALVKRYDRFIMMNASIRGPFLPVWSRQCWSDVYLDKITDTTKLIGMTYNCDPYFGTPHIQSMLLATDRTGLLTLFPILSCAADWMAAVYMESNATAAIKSAGYDVFAMMTAFSSHSEYTSVCDNGDVLFEGTYFGGTIHPYEMVFQKANRNVGLDTLERLTEWTDQAGYSSWEVCGRGARENMGALGGWGRWNQTPHE